MALPQNLSSGMDILRQASPLTVASAYSAIDTRQQHQALLLTASAGSIL